ncbi:TPA: hypothetical protein U2B17_000292 [Streptococcus suis]|nr:hypothetical protein [Streptococcus suis]HEM5939364.1 hypothetical protein [Streptococcus suis]HEM5949924.1 hypothetical protein [Streptococcus suis]HEM5951892.1 hypothetical protein [Streptococcus suis]HEM5958421.1 hypothetical protein [Streptococcus suis]
MLFYQKKTENTRLEQEKIASVFFILSRSFLFLANLKNSDTYGCQRVYFSDIALYVLDEIDTHYQSRKARGYYSQNRYPQDLEFVTGLIRNTREEEGV